MRLYILQKLSKKPSHGYEIMKEIDEKTGGSWRPGPGSVYLILKELLSENLIEEVRGKKGAAEQRAYTVTSEGLKQLNATKKSFTGMGERYLSLRRLFLEMIDAEDAGRFLVQGTMRHIEMTHELFQKCQNLEKDEKRYMLKEYQLMLEKEAGWVKGALGKIDGASVRGNAMSIRTGSR